jgi:hypothetical protein
MPVNVGNTFKESDGKAVTLQLVEDVDAPTVIHARSFFGVTMASGKSGDFRAITIDRFEYQFTVPAGLTIASAGVRVYVTLADITANIIPDAAYSTTGGAGKHCLFISTGPKDSNNVVTGILNPEGI